MESIQKTLPDFSLKTFNTFGIDVRARVFAEIKSIEDLAKIPDLGKQPLLILGGGSNILFTKDFEGLVIHNTIKGISITKETDTEVWIKAASGEIWDDLVQYCVAKNYGGIENLSLIPGTVGAAPMQNIGAYGAELKDVFESLEAIDLASLSPKTFALAECAFGYRDSIFKNAAKGLYFIASVTLRLQKFPKTNSAYGAIQNLLEQEGIGVPTIADIRRVVCDIRNSKLPNPAVIGNAGSFFKNPEITESQYNDLKDRFPDMPGYHTHKGIKVPAGWLIESCGWKGKRVGETGSHKDQALVLVNYGHATGQEVLALAKAIQLSVREKFGIDIQTEVNAV